MQYSSQRILLLVSVKRHNIYSEMQSDWVSITWLIQNWYDENPAKLSFKFSYTFIEEAKIAGRAQVRTRLRDVILTKSSALRTTHHPGRPRPPPSTVNSKWFAGVMTSLYDTGGPYLSAVHVTSSVPDNVARRSVTTITRCTSMSLVSTVWSVCNNQCTTIWRQRFISLFVELVSINMHETSSSSRFSAASKYFQNPQTNGNKLFQK